MWQNRRSPRGRLVASDREVVQIATLINDLVDLPYWSEEEEQELFECATMRCVEAIAGSIPPPLIALLRKREGLEEKEAMLLGQNLVQVCRKNVDLPYLDEQDKRRIIRGVVWVLVGAMQGGREVKDFTENLETNPSAQEIIVNVFMEGAMDVFFEEELRKGLVSDMTSLIKEVPFVPPGLIEKVCEQILVGLSGSLREALKIAFQEFRAAAREGQELSIEPKGLEGEREREWIAKCYENKPFLIQLRRVFVSTIQDDLMKSKRYARMLAPIPEKWRTWVLSRFLDAVFAELEGIEKIEDSVQLFKVHEEAPPSEKSESKAEDRSSKQLSRRFSRILAYFRTRPEAPEMPELFPIEVPESPWQEYIESASSPPEPSEDAAASPRAMPKLRFDQENSFATISTRISGSSSECDYCFDISTPRSCSSDSESELTSLQRPQQPPVSAQGVAAKGAYKGVNSNGSLPPFVPPMGSETSTIDPWEVIAMREEILVMRTRLRTFEKAERETTERRERAAALLSGSPSMIAVELTLGSTPSRTASPASM